MPPTVRQRNRARLHRAGVERAILDAAERLLSDRPLRDLTVEDLMAQAGLTRTAFYRYFPDLESVLLRWLLDITVDLTTAAARWLAPGADPEAGLLVAAIGLAEVYRDHGPVLLAFADAASRAPEIEAAWHRTIDSFVAPVTDRIRALEAQGLVRLTHPEQTARALVWMIERYYLECYGRGPDVAVELAGETIAEIWRRVLFPGIKIDKPV